MNHEVNNVASNEPERDVPGTISELVPGFLEHLRVEEGRRPGTLERYQRHMDRLIAEVGDRPVGSINSEVLSLYKRRLMDAGLSPATMRGLLSCLKQFLRYAREIRRLTVMDPEKVRGPRVPFREVEYLTKEEVMRFLDAFPSTGFAGPRDRALAEMLCGTGMRISEALSLDRHQIDWEAREALVIGKGGKPRKVYFSEEVLRSLRRYLDLRRENEPALFVTQGSNPKRLAPHGTWKRFRRYARSAGLTKAVYPHMLRHTMATTLLTNGCPVGHIRVLLGHSHLATTCRYYLGRLSDAEAKAAHKQYLSYGVGQGTSDPLPG